MSVQPYGKKGLAINLTKGRFRWTVEDEILLVQEMELMNLPPRLNKTHYRKLVKVMGDDFSDNQVKSKIYALKRKNKLQYNKILEIVKYRGGLPKEEPKKDMIPIQDIKTITFKDLAIKIYKYTFTVNGSIEIK